MLDTAEARERLSGELEAITYWHNLVADYRRGHAPLGNDAYRAGWRAAHERLEQTLAQWRDDLRAALAAARAAGAGGSSPPGPAQPAAA